MKLLDSFWSVLSGFFLFLPRTSPSSSARSKQILVANKSGSLSFGPECSSYYGTTSDATRGKIRSEIWKEARREVGLSSSFSPSSPPVYLFESHPYSEITACSSLSSSSLAYKEVWKSGNNFFEGNLARLCKARKHAGRTETFVRKDLLLFSFVRDPFLRFVSAYKEVAFRYFRSKCSPPPPGVAKRSLFSSREEFPMPSCFEMKNDSVTTARKILARFFSGRRIPEELHFALQSAFLLARPPFPSFYGTLERQAEEWKRLCALPPTKRRGRDDNNAQVCDPSVGLDPKIGVHKDTSSDSMSHGKGLLLLLEKEPKWRRGVDVLLRMDRSCFSFQGRGSRIWKEVLSFSAGGDGDRVVAARRRETGVLRSLSPTTPDALVYILEEKEEHHVHLQWSQDRLPVARLIHCEPKSFRVEVDLADRTIVGFLLAVHPSRFAEEMSSSSGFVVGEAEVVSLVCSVSSHAHVPSPILPPPPVLEKTTQTGKNNAEEEGWRIPLMPHQEAAVSWMRSVEEECVVSVGRRISLPSTGWGVDLTDSSLVQDSRRDEKLFSFRTKGGILADGAGMGKTATALRLVSETRGRPTLAVVPLNLPSQWIGEVEKFAPFLRVTRLLTGKDARSTTLSCLESSDLVITTPSFFKNGAYSDLVEGLIAAEQQQHPAVSLGGKISMEKLRGLRSAILSAWERRTRERGGEGEAPPLLEAVRWGRLLVDEIHEMGKEGKKGWKGEREGGWSLPSFLRGLRFEKVWGLSATPGLDEGGKHSLLSLFADLPPFSVSLLPSPQLVSSLTRSCVRGSPSPRLPRSSLRLIDVGGKEGDDLRAETRERPLEEAIRRVCAFADVEGEGCSLLTSSSSFPSFASSSIRRLAAREDVCTLCEDRSCDAATSCGHVYCSSCLLRCIGLSSSCPACRAALTTQDVHLVLSPPANAKLTVIRDLVLSNAPSIVFAQWKDTLRSIRSLLRSSERGGGEEGGAIGLLLEGNAVQRASILSEFERKGGVLLICLSDSFAGLHLPFVETVLFAHALVGDKKSVSDVETQAIARAIRKGRRGTVRVFHVVLSDCAEEELWRSTH